MTAVVTGGNRGIGLAVARRLAADGHDVVVSSRSGDPVEGLHVVRCDVTVPDDVAALVAAAREAHGPVTTAVACAGVSEDALLIRTDEERWARVLDANLSGAFRLAREAGRDMLRARHGRLVLIGSVVGLLGGEGQAGYAASKAALVGLARSVARELGARGVTANVVAPGFVETDMTAGMDPRRREAVLERTPTGRLVEADEVAAAVSWLCSDAAGSVTGAVVPVDGGLGLGH